MSASQKACLKTGSKGWNVVPLLFSNSRGKKISKVKVEGGMKLDMAGSKRTGFVHEAGFLEKAQRGTYNLRCFTP